MPLPLCSCPSWAPIRGPRSRTSCHHRIASLSPFYLRRDRATAGRGRRCRSPSRHKAIIAAIASVLGSLVMGATLILIQDLMRESREQLRYQAREGFTVVEKGQQVRIERTAQEPLVLTCPK